MKEVLHTSPPNPTFVLQPQQQTAIFIPAATICIFSRCLLPCLECLDPSEQSDWDDIEDTMDNELLSLSKPWFGEGEGNWGDQGCWSLHLLLCPWPLEGCWHPHSSSEP